MSEFCFVSYVEAIRPFLMKNSSKEDAALFLLDSVRSQTNDKKDMKKDGSLKRIIRGVLPVPEEIRLAAAKSEIADGVASYFHKEVAQDLNPHLIDDAKEVFTRLLNSDDTIPDSRKEKLMALLKGDDFALFLSQSFIYAISRPFNKSTEDGHQKISIPLLIFTLLYGLGIYFLTMLTMINMREISQPLMAFAFFFAIGLFVFLIGFYFFLWRRDI